MVSLDSAISSNKSYFHSRTQPLVIVTAGSTSGIGRATLLQLCRAHGSTGPGLRVYIPARSAPKAAQLIEDCRALCPEGDFRFVEVRDLSLLREVDECCRAIVAQERELVGEKARLDVLIMTQGAVSFVGRQETSEGLDTSQSLLLFSRLQFIHSLSPLFPPTSTPNPTRIISVYAAGYESTGTLHTSDLTLQQPNHYSFSACRVTCIHMKTLLFEHLAQTQYAGRVSCVHVNPGIVVTPAAKAATNPVWFKVAWFVVSPFVRLFLATSEEEIGQRITFLAISERYPAEGQVVKGKVADGTDGVKGSGAYAVKNNGEVIDVRKRYEKLRKDGFGENVVDFTDRLMKEIEEGKKFTG